MEKPQVPQKAPYTVDVEKGKRYFWCACGKSANQPLCDGSHKDSPFRPEIYTATKNQTIMFCGCKNSKKPPLCDGSHSRL